MLLQRVSFLSITEEGIDKRAIYLMTNLFENSLGYRGSVNNLYSPQFVRGGNPISITQQDTSRHKNLLFELINIPGIVGAVLQTPWSFINSVTHPLQKYLQNTFTPKPEG